MALGIRDMAKCVTCPMASRGPTQKLGTLLFWLNTLLGQMPALPRHHLNRPLVESLTSINFPKTQFFQYPTLQKKTKKSLTEKSINSVN